MRFANLGTSSLRLVIGAAIALAVVVAGNDARAQEVTDYEVTTGLVCNTSAQVERFVSLYNGDDTAKAIRIINAEEHNDQACAVATLAFVRGKEAGTIHRGDHAYTIVHILVLGVETEQGIRPIAPAAFFTVFSVKEYGV
jgi:hypothetical protein